MKTLRNPIVSGWLLLASATAFADGSENLGPPSIPIASGTGIVIEGTGMLAQPGTINLSVPSGATVKQVLLYWEGWMTTNVPGDNTVSISDDGGVTSTSVTGTLIGGPTLFSSTAFASTFRADITNLGLVSDGTTTLQVSDMAFTRVNNGAGLLVRCGPGRCRYCDS